MAVLCAPAGDDLVAALPPDRELKGVDAVADLDLLEEPRRVFGECRRLVEVAVDCLEEARRWTHRLRLPSVRDQAQYAGDARFPKIQSCYGRLASVSWHVRAAVDVHRLSRDVARVVTCAEHHHCGRGVGPWPGPPR